MLFGETPQSTQIFNGALRRAINNELFLLKNIDNMIVGKVDLYKKKKIMLLSVMVRELRALKVVNAKIS